MKKFHNRFLKALPHLFYLYFLYNVIMSWVSVTQGSALEWISHTTWAVLSYFFYMNTKCRANVIQNVTIHTTSKEDLETAVKSAMEQLREGANQ